MATVNLTLRKSYKSKDKKYPVVFVIRNLGNHSLISTGIRLPQSDWDDKKWIKSATKEIINPAKENNKLLRELGNIQEFISGLTLSGEIRTMTPAQIIRRYQKQQEKKNYNFNSYFREVIAGKKAEQTKAIFGYTLILIEKFSSELQFSDVNVKFLREFESWMIKRGLKTNSISIHLRNIRTVFNQAIDDDLIELNLYPFRKFKIKSEKTVKRNLTIDEMKRFKDIPLSGVPGLSRDVFMLSFYLIGINLIDLVNLTKDNIKADRIEYKRRKTGKNYSIKLEPEAKELIRKLRGSKYLICLAERYHNYDAIKKEINKKLKVAAREAKIDKRVSTYFARHAWATIASKLDTPKETISAALGHEIGSRITSLYINFDESKIDLANRKVIDAISHL